MIADAFAVGNSSGTLSRTFVNAARTSTADHCVLWFSDSGLSIGRLESSSTLPALNSSLVEMATTFPPGCPWADELAAGNSLTGPLFPAAAIGSGEGFAITDLPTSGAGLLTGSLFRTGEGVTAF